MMVFTRVLERVRTSFWFIPSLMTLGAGITVTLTLMFDARRDVSSLGWIYHGSADATRQILGSLVASIVSVIGVVFSITIIALSFSSRALGPRLMRNFMRHRFLQAVVGSVTAILVFVLAVLVSIDETGGNSFIPHVSVNMTFILTGLLILILIFFLHFVGISILTDHVVDALTCQARAVIEREWEKPEDGGESRDSSAEHEFPGDGEPVCSKQDGYVIEIRWAALMQWMQSADARIEVKVRPGDFVSRGETVAVVHRGDGPRQQASNPESSERLVVVGPTRTETQDIEYRLHALAEVAIRALSPGVNDPYTAIACVDKMSAVIAVCAARREPARRLYDEDGSLRIVRKTAGFEDVMDAAWNQVRQHANRDVAVGMRILEALERIGRGLEDHDRIRCVRRHAELVLEGFQGAFQTRHDEEDFRRRLKRVRRTVTFARGRASRRSAS